MNTVDAICAPLQETQKFINYFLGDLSDADFLVRPVEGANHVAWQLGHLILTERTLSDQDPAFVYPAIPAGFDKGYTKETAALEPATGFLSREAYLKLFNETRDATIAGVKKLSAETLDKPLTGPAAAWAPNLAGLLTLTATHTMMHGGQFSVIRRKLGKPVLF